MQPPQRNRQVCVLATMALNMTACWVSATFLQGRVSFNGIELTFMRARQNITCTNQLALRTSVCIEHSKRLRVVAVFFYVHLNQSFLERNTTLTVSVNLLTGGTFDRSMNRKVNLLKANYQISAMKKP